MRRFSINLTVNRRDNRAGGTLFRHRCACVGRDDADDTRKATVCSRFRAVAVRHPSAVNIGRPHYLIGVRPRPRSGGDSVPSRPRAERPNACRPHAIVGVASRFVVSTSHFGAGLEMPCRSRYGRCCGAVVGFYGSWIKLAKQVRRLVVPAPSWHQVPSAQMRAA